MKNIAFILLFLPIVSISSDYEYRDNRGRVIESYSVDDDKIIIKDNRGRTKGYIKESDIFDNRGRRKGHIKKDII